MKYENELLFDNPTKCKGCGCDSYLIEIECCDSCFREKCFRCETTFNMYIVINCNYETIKACEECFHTHRCEQCNLFLNQCIFRVQEE